jgi:hypothetical protein
MIGQRRGGEGVSLFGFLRTFRSDIATSIAPRVDKVNDMLGTQLQAVDATTIGCILILMVALLCADKILVDIAGKSLSKLLLFALVWLTCLILTKSEANGTCAPLSTLADLVSCGPRALKWVSDITKPFVGDAPPWLGSVQWISWAIWFVAMLPIFAAGATLALLALFFVASIVVAVILGAFTILEKLFIYLDYCLHP